MRLRMIDDKMVINMLIAADNGKSVQQRVDSLAIELWPNFIPHKLSTEVKTIERQMDVITLIREMQSDVRALLALDL